MLVSAWIVIAVLVVAAVGGVWAVLWERRFPTSFTQRPGVMGNVPDEVALDAAERREQGRLRTQSEWRGWDPDVVAEAAEVAGSRAVEEAARVNVHFHP